MASKPNPAFELLQLLTVLGVQIDNDDSLSRVSPSFLESQVQTYLSYTQQADKLATPSKIEIKEVKDVKGADLKAYGSAQIHGGGHHHGHSHGEDDHGHGHSHSHGGEAGHGHGHSHGGHSHGGHSHGGGGGGGHGHTHGGEPCTGHGDEDEEEEEEEEACDSDHDHDHDHDHDDDDDGDTTNQALLALRHYMSILTQGIQQAWSKPPLFPGAPKANTWVLREQGNSPSQYQNQSQDYDLCLTVAGLTTLPTSGDEETPAILLHYTLDSPAARKGLWGDIMSFPLPREILHLLRLLLDFNSRKCPSFKPFPGAHVGALGGATGFKQSFIVPVSDKTPAEEQVGKLDLRKDGLGKLVGCDVCGLLGPDLKCAKCKKRTYCSGGCQRKDWKEHKNTCGK